LNLDMLEQTIAGYRLYSAAIGNARQSIVHVMHSIQSCYSHGVITRGEAEESLILVECLLTVADTAPCVTLNIIARVASRETERLWKREMAFKNKYGIWTYLPDEEKARCSESERADLLRLDSLRVANAQRN
jgi:hypothetical protein